MGKLGIRKPVVAGQFYPGSAAELIKEIEKFTDKLAVKAEAIACMLPHAGYTYSGRVAVETVSRINIKDKIILLGPNHTGNGAPFSIQAQGTWQTPLGDLEIDSDLAKNILARSQYLKEDSAAHLSEHSLEVELPILQFFRKSFQIVPICILSDDLDILKEIGASVAEAVCETKQEGSVLIVASSDMTHYEPQPQASKKDRAAIEAILDLDIEQLTRKVQDLNITMCGYAPVCAMLVCAKLLGATIGELVKYQTSGEITGDNTSVVGYAGIIIH
jgi:AmmeMemoRadiSam system protein B